jgi:hypothetical protein
MQPQFVRWIFRRALCSGIEVAYGYEIIVGARRLLRPRNDVVRQPDSRSIACETAQAPAQRLGVVSKKRRRG